MVATERLTAWNGGEVERAIVDAVSLDVPWRVVERFATLTRLSGSAEEREAFELLIDHLRERREVGADVFFIQHIHAHAVAERLAERGRELYGRDPEFVSGIGPVIGAHVGPGLVGVSGLPTRLLGPV